MNYKMISGMALCLLLIGSAFGYGGGGGYIYNKVNKMENNNQLQSFNFKSKISIQQDLTGIFEDVTLKNTERGSISVIESDKFNDRIFRGHKAGA
jgi:hypothetical protein